MNMKPTLRKFTAGRRRMIDAFAELTTLAARAGVDSDEITALHGRFFDGNVMAKDAFVVALLVAAANPEPGGRRQGE